VLLRLALFGFGVTIAPGGDVSGSG
jgi:hypothetical protein